MDAFFTSEQEELRATVRRFLKEKAPLTYVRSVWDDPRGTTDEVWGGLSSLELTGLLVPEALGGSGVGMQEAGVVGEPVFFFLNAGDSGRP